MFSFRFFCFAFFHSRENVLHVKKNSPEKTTRECLFVKSRKVVDRKINFNYRWFLSALSERTWQELWVSCLIKYFEERKKLKILCKFFFFNAQSGLLVDCLFMSYYCVHFDPQHFPASRLHYNCSFHRTTNMARREREKMLNWKFLAHFGADHFHFNAFNTWLNTIHYAPLSLLSRRLLTYDNLMLIHNSLGECKRDWNFAAHFVHSLHFSLFTK